MLKKTEAYKLVFELRDAVRQWDQWNPTPEQKEMFQNEGVKPVPNSLKEAIINVGEAFQIVDIEQGAWELAMAVDKFYAEFGRWASSIAAAPDAVHPGGSIEMWETFRDLLRVADNRLPPAPPAAVILQTQGANARTIALRYGWYTPDGNADIQRVNRELAAAPEDREYDPETWVHPRERAFFENTKRKFEERCQKLQEVQARLQPRNVQRKPSKESWESLFELPYMTVRNVALLKMVTEDEVRAKADELGYVPSVEGFRRAHESGRVRRGDKEPDWLLRNDPHDECGDDIEARIMACYQDGLTKAKSIADLLAGSRNLPVTVQQVSKILKKHAGAKDEVAA